MCHYNRAVRSGGGGHGQSLFTQQSISWSRNPDTACPVWRVTQRWRSGHLVSARIILNPTNCHLITHWAMVTPPPLPGPSRGLASLIILLESVVWHQPPYQHISISEDQSQTCWNIAPGPRFWSTRQRSLLHNYLSMSQHRWRPLLLQSRREESGW